VLTVSYNYTLHKVSKYFSCTYTGQYC